MLFAQVPGVRALSTATLSPAAPCTANVALDWLGPATLTATTEAAPLPYRCSSALKSVSGLAPSSGRLKSSGSPNLLRASVRPDRVTGTPMGPLAAVPTTPTMPVATLPAEIRPSARTVMYVPGTTISVIAWISLVNSNGQDVYERW